MSPDHAQALKKLFSLLFMMMGPMGLLPVFAGLTAHAERSLQVRIAWYAAGYAALALTLATFIGIEVLTGWGAQPSSLLIAAGFGFEQSTGSSACRGGLGYEVPWRQVHELLCQAALTTPAIQDEPAPYVSDPDGLK